MTGGGEIRVDSGRASREPPGWSLPAAIIVVVVGVLALAGPLGDGGVGSDDTLPDLLREADTTVAAFASAWERGDTAAMERLIALEWEGVALPGLLDGRVEPSDGREALRDALGFLSRVSDLSLDRCSADGATAGPRVTATVLCEGATIEGAYLDAVGRDTWGGREAVADLRVPGLEFRLRGDRIVAIESRETTFSPQAYCIWAEQNRPELARSRFDLHCRPVTSPPDAAAHVQMARAFMEAGGPLPSWREAEARLAAAYVDRFAEHHNLGDIFTAYNWLSREIEPNVLPGSVHGSEAPSAAEHLWWSAGLFDIVTGECSVAVGDGLTVVTCPDMELAGPYLSEPVPQPTRFVLNSFRTRRAPARAFARIAAIEPLSSVEISVDALCRRVQESDPENAMLRFTSDCAPVYDRDAATA